MFQSIEPHTDLNLHVFAVDASIRLPQTSVH